ncbi:MAG: hypothetical protein JXB49_11245 [Bacteroidales bacterium]|nr:hypothetical protein [Bacteroidales bacterium]
MIAITILIVVFSILVFLAGLILLIIGLSNGNKKLSIPGGAMAGLSILLFIGVFAFNMYRMALGIGKVVKRAGEKIETYKPEINEMQKKIREYALDTMNVPENFYSDLGFRDYYRLPLPYPYYIKSIENLDCGRLNSEWEFKPDYKDLGYITHLIFDRNYLLVRSSTEDWDNLENGSVSFKIFNFQTNATYSYDSFDEMKVKALELGFKEEIEFLSLDDYYWLL